MTEFARRSARVLLLDAADRLLLVRFARMRSQPDGRDVWFTPGGGVEDGEDPPSAAARELREETGLAVPARELRLVAYTTGQADLGWAKGLFRDDFFLCRVDRHEVKATGLTEFERQHYAGHHWWSHAELAATGEIIYPYGLAALVAELIAGRVPEVPVALPWHH